MRSRLWPACWGTAWRRALSPAVEAVVLKCMAKKSSDRFASMRELELALVQEEQFLEPMTSGGTTMLVRPRHTEKTSAVLDEPEKPEAGDGAQPDTNVSPQPGHGRNPAEAFGGAQTVDIAHQKLTHGDRCPECGKGNVYGQREPKVLVRIVGQAPGPVRLEHRTTWCSAIGGSSGMRPRGQARRPSPIRHQ